MVSSVFSLFTFKFNVPRQSFTIFFNTSERELSSVKKSLSSAYMLVFLLVCLFFLLVSFHLNLFIMFAKYSLELCRIPEIPSPCGDPIFVFTFSFLYFPNFMEIKKTNIKLNYCTTNNHQQRALI